MRHICVVVVVDDVQHLMNIVQSPIQTREKQNTHSRAHKQRIVCASSLCSNQTDWTISILNDRRQSFRLVCILFIYLFRHFLFVLARSEGSRSTFFCCVHSRRRYLSQCKVCTLLHNILQSWTFFLTEPFSMICTVNSQKISLAQIKNLFMTAICLTMSWNF